MCSILVKHSFVKVTAPPVITGTITAPPGITLNCNLITKSVMIMTGLITYWKYSLRAWPPDWTLYLFVLLKILTLNLN